MFQYCIMCNEFDEVIEGSHRAIVIHDEYPYHWIEWRECDGPFATCPPPIFDLEPVDNISPSELAVMDINADVLLSELQGG